LSEKLNTNIDPAVPRIDLRITGPWQNPHELIAQLLWKRTGYELADQHFVHLESGRKVTWGVTDHDDEIAELFAQGDRLSKEEVEEVAGHAVKVHLQAPGGSIAAARDIMHAATALVKAGGTGVMIDNSGLTHSAREWLKLDSDSQDNPTPGGTYWAYVATTRTKDAMFTTGMHCFGLRDGELPYPPDAQISARILHGFLGYTYTTTTPVQDNDPVGDEEGALWRARAYECERIDPGTPFFNPYGIWRLEPIDLEAQAETEGQP